MIELCQMSGYLGVVIFFVINGFLVVPGIVSKIEEGQFEYFKFIKKKIIGIKYGDLTALPCPFLIGKSRKVIHSTVILLSVPSIAM